MVALTEQDKQQEARRAAALAATVQLRRELDQAFRDVREDVAKLQVRGRLAAHAVGGDSTRPGYTEDLQRLRHQQARLQRLTELVEG